MKETKTEFKYFTMAKYRDEEKYLRKMHKMGWKFTKVTFPGFYHFTKCEPEDMVYKLDYSKIDSNGMDEYIHLFEDCGWEYLTTFVGYTYFRKSADQNETNNDIFCDDESRFAMLKKAYGHKALPLVILFFTIIMPQFLLNALAPSATNFIDMIRDVLAYLFLAIGILYLVEFLVFAKQLSDFAKELNIDDSGMRTGKYLVISAVAVCVLVFAISMIVSFSSDYEVVDRDNGFAIVGEKINKSIKKQYCVKKGDVISFDHQAEQGEWYISVKTDENHNIFFGNTYEDFGEFTVKIPEDGTYTITCNARRGKGSLDVSIE